MHGKDGVKIKKWQFVWTIRGKWLNLQDNKFSMKTHLNTIPAKFKQVVAQSPDNTAIIDSDFREYTYAELARMADGIRAVFPTDAPARVGILTGHGAVQIAAIMAVVSSGAAYVALEPAIPGEKIRRIFDEAQVDFVLTGRANVHRVKDYMPVVLPSADALMVGADGLPVVDVKPEMPAYILYTAGRTGKRKGVVVQHDNVTNYVSAFEHEFKIRNGYVILQSSVCTFDTFVEEVFVSLLSGATLAILPETCRGDILSIVDYAERAGVNLISGFTSMVASLNKLGKLPSSLRLLVANGRPLRADDIDWLRDKVIIYYTYGVSETTVRTAWQRCDNYVLAENATTYPVGRPIEGVEMALLNENLQPVAPGEIGEICIFGESITRGYVNADDDQTNWATMPDGRRVYLTGDFGLWDGATIQIVDMPENSVTIEGRDVKFSEVESALRQDPNVGNGVVRSFTDSKGRPYLVAYFTARYEKMAVSMAELRKNIKSRLAWFKVPEFFVQMHSLPRKGNGKVAVNDLPQILKDK